MQQPIIQVKNVVKEFTVGGGLGKEEIFRALHGVSFDLYAGKTLALVGESGCGKTTLLKTILGTHAIFSGEVLLNEQPVNRKSSRKFGYVPQLESVDWSFPVTVEEVIMMGLYAGKRLLPWQSREERERVHDLAEKLGIFNCLKQHIAYISGGQRQRTFLARALINNPQLLVLDEPTSGVDIKTQHEVLHLLGDINSQGMTILLTTHDRNAVASHLPGVICFKNGLVAEGRPRDIFTNKILAETYGSDIIIIKHGDYYLIANSTPLNL